MRAVCLTCVLAGCAEPALECGDGQGSLDLTSTDGGFLYTDDALPIMEIDLSTEAMAGLATSSQDDLPDVLATFGFGAESYDVGLHLKGSSSFLPIDQKAAFKMDFHQWDPEGLFHGVRRLTLNNMTGDPSSIAEHLGYAFYAQLGLPAARHGYACVVLNGEDRGLYGVVETMDEQFLDRAFVEPDGNLYEGTFGADIRTGATAGYIPQEIGDVTDGSDLVQLAAAFDRAAPEDVLDTLAAHFDIDELLDAWATELVIGNIDGYLVMTNNYLLYHQPVADRWTFLPWGLDEVFAEKEDKDLAAYVTDAGNFRGVLYMHCLAAPACVSELEEHVVSVGERMEALDLAGQAQDEIERLRTVSRQDPWSPVGPLDTRAAQIQLHAWIKGRPRDVARAFGG